MIFDVSNIEIEVYHKIGTKSYQGKMLQLLGER